MSERFDREGSESSDFISTIDLEESDGVNDDVLSSGHQSFSDGPTCPSHPAPHKRPRLPPPPEASGVGTVPDMAAIGSHEVEDKDHGADEWFTFDRVLEGIQKEKGTQESSERPKCVECGRTFAHKSQLNTHMRQHTGEKHNLKEHPERKDPEKNPEKPNSYKCPDCPEVFDNGRSLSNHRRRHNKKKPAIKEDEGASDEERGSLHVNRIGMLAKRKVEYRCTHPLCKASRKRFGNAGALANHMRIHSNSKSASRKKNSKIGGRSYNCRECSETFDSKAHMISHMRNHPSVAAYSCAACSRRFLYRSTLERHSCTKNARMINQGAQKDVLREPLPLSNDTRNDDQKEEKPYVCPVPGCRKTYKHKQTLQGHMRTHEENPKYACHYKGCGKVFGYPNDLKRHLERHERKEEEKERADFSKLPFKCASCGAGFASREERLEHVDGDLCINNRIR